MDTDESNVEEIFFCALEKGSAEELAAYLEEVCEGNEPLRNRVQRLLDAKPKLGSFLQGDAGDITVDQLITDQFITEKPGAEIGPYKLLQQLGEGGMGVVYMAEQKAPVKRRVALKIIKPGMDTRQVITRFEAERQALAIMDHPNIAKVLDAGATESGRPYFVMELVKGVPVTKYCDEQHLTPRERLELFVPICQAVQHAHQKGIIHRDLKPGNILVALYDGKPIPKVIDFGVAKATSQTLTEKTMFTQVGQVVGTLEYMSPEQAQVNQLDVDTRSDIYSLGVVLYELLSGEMPFDRARLRSAAFDEILRIIREEEPSKPSTKVSSSEALPSIAANRRIEPARLSSMIRGELDWIVLKAMEKDRGRRYETASKFAEDVQHYLNDEAVVACPPSRMYRFRKFARRNKTVFATFVVVASVVLAGLAGTTWQMLRALSAEHTAQVETKRADAEAAEASLAARRALAAEREAVTRAAEAEKQRHRAERQFRLAESSRLAVTGGNVLASNPRVAIELILQAVETTVSAGELIQPGVEEVLRKVILETGGSVFASPGVEIVQTDYEDVNRIALSADGRRLAAADSRGVIRIWDTNARSPSTPQLLFGHGSHVGTLDFDRSGRWLLSGSADFTARVWDLESPDPSDSHVILQGHTSTVFAQFHPDGRHVVTSSIDKTARIWDLHAEDPSESPAVLQHDHPLTGNFEVSHDARWLATMPWTERHLGSVYLWDLTAEDPAKTRIELPSEERIIFDLTISPDSQELATAGSGGSIAIWKLNDTALQQELLSPDRLIRQPRLVKQVAFSPDGNWLTTLDADRMVRLVRRDNPSEEAQVLETAVDRSQFDMIRFSPDSHYLIFSGREILRWDLQGDSIAQSKMSLGKTSSPPRTLVVSPDGEFLYVASQISIDRWPLKQSPRHAALLRGTKIQQTLSMVGQGNLSLSPDDRWLAVCTSRRSIDLVDLQSEFPFENTIRLPVEEFGYRGWSSTSDWFWYSNNKDNNFQIWQINNNGVIEKTLEVPYHPFAQMLPRDSHLAFIPGARTRRFVTSGSDKALRSWEIRDDGVTLLSSLSGVSADGPIQVSQDGRWLLTHHTSRFDDSSVTTSLIGIDNNGVFTTLNSLDQHEEPVLSLTLSPKSDFALTSSRNSVLLWDLRKEMPWIAPRHLPIHGAYQMRISPDGALVATRDDFATRIWRLDNDSITELTTLPVREGYFAFSPNNKWFSDRTHAVGSFC